ncbi:hypothetical protein SEA_ABBA_33 [Arthrobacter phage Abba]|uniref:Uncharacterized protein n=1 Tax=Arthrobacter phage Abba TaxID=2713256 RepID=A0A6G8R2E8_9CAUD|nr:hypothetical protein HYQ28_gp33 [Arthrobacter phage Abba]QIN94362.1 hypothetical protein SEA_ABBA_33 [Arthrobacter phage Abba]
MRFPAHGALFATPQSLIEQRQHISPHGQVVGAPNLSTVCAGQVATRRRVEYPSKWCMFVTAFHTNRY